MRTLRAFTSVIILISLCFGLTACGGGGSSAVAPPPPVPPPPPPPAITSFELLDPTPGTGDQFGQIVTILANGNIVVSDPFDSSVTPSGGAVHLFDPTTQTLIASIYGDNAFDLIGFESEFGRGGIIGLPNSNYVINSPVDDDGGIENSGSVRLVDGSTGAQIGSLVGDTLGDQMGSGGITVLPNNNFVIVTLLDDEGGIEDASSVRLVNGTSGAQIGGTVAGDTSSDLLGLGGITVLANNNFVIASPADDEGSIVRAGSARLMDGTTGAQIGSTLAGDTTDDKVAMHVAALANSNFVIASPNETEGGISHAGTVRLMNGTTGAQIGSTLVGDAALDSLGSQGIFSLANNNFVIASVFDDEGGIVDAGSIRLVDGVTGVQIGSTLTGDTTLDLLGLIGITVLANNNFVIAAPFDDEGGIVNAGSTRLVDGGTGAQIGNTLVGNVEDDRLGSGFGAVALANSNFVVLAPEKDEGGIVNAGSVRLVDGATGSQIGSTLAGDTEHDQMGSSGITVLVNDNFVVGTTFDDEGGVANAGSVRLVDGTTGAQIGMLAGDETSDLLGSHGVTALANGNFVIVSASDSEGGIVNAGSVRLVDGRTGTQIGSTTTGSVSNDMNEVHVTGSADGEFYILGLWQADNNGMVDSGLVRLIAQ